MLQGYEIKFNIYADNAEEANVAREAIVSFINVLASKGVAVKGDKITEAINKWDKNPFIKSKIIEFFS